MFRVDSLDPVEKESSLQFVKGSHRWPAHNPHHFGDDSPYEGTGLPELPNIDSEIEEYEILRWDMVPGDCLVFQGMSVHGSMAIRVKCTGGGRWRQGGAETMPDTVVKPAR